MTSLTSASHVHIVTDSTSELSPQEAIALGVTVVPMTVRFGDQHYVDGVDLAPPEFYDLLARSSTFPSTEPPSAALLYEAYTQAASQGAAGVVSIHLSSRLSETAAHAAEAAHAIAPYFPVAVVDTQQVSIGMLPAVRFAAQMAMFGAPLPAIRDAVHEILRRTQVIYVVDTLEYLHRGGRIGGAARLLGTLLDAKPILTVQQGEVTPVETVRPRERAHDRLVELVRALGDVREAYIGQTSDELGQEMVARMRQFYASYLQRSWIGATVGAHVGIGVGISVVTR